jgi:hypothetical protein
MSRSRFAKTPRARLVGIALPGSTAHFGFQIKMQTGVFNYGHIITANASPPAPTKNPQKILTRL